MYSQMRNVSTNSYPQNENIKCNETKLQMLQDENIKSQTGDGSIGFFHFPSAPVSWVFAQWWGSRFGVSKVGLKVVGEPPNCLKAIDIYIYIHTFFYIYIYRSIHIKKCI